MKIYVNPSKSMDRQRVGIGDIGTETLFFTIWHACKSAVNPVNWQSLALFFKKVITTILTVTLSPNYLIV